MINKEKNFLSVIIYLHNNENKIKEFTQQIIPIFNNRFEKLEFIFVDDASTDKTLALLKETFELTKCEHTVQLIKLNQYQGMESAMNAGIDLSIGDFVFEFDTIYIDYPADLVFKVYDRALQGGDIVSAVPEIVKGISSKLFYKVYNHFCGEECHIKSESFRILSRRAINRVHSMSHTIPYRKALYANCGLNKSSIFYNNHDRQEILFREHHELVHRYKTAIDALILFTDVGYKFSFLLTFCMILTSIGIGGYAVWVFLTKQPVSGWTSLILFLSISFSGLFAVLAVLVKYMDILLNLNFKKQEYLIEKIEKW